MASLFISHSSHDRALAERLRDWLISEGYAALFVDFDPQLGIPAGRNWERELYSQLRRADYVLLILTDSAATSQWCFAEVSLARSLGKTVIALQVDPDARLGLTTDSQAVRFSADARSFDELGRHLERAGLTADQFFEWSTDRGPSPGLAPFTAADAAVFFGRAAEIDDVLEMLQSTLHRGTGQFVAIVGPSGSGKSSLMRAGIIPRLRRRPEWLVLPPLLPGQRPTENLARCIWHALRDVGIDRPLDAVTAAVAQGPSVLVDLLHHLGGTSGEHRILLPIDQAEELVTRAGREEQHAFLGLLRAVLCAEPDLWVLATLRSEFLSSDVERAGIAEIIDKTKILEPLSQHQLPEVIVGPAQRAGVDFSPGLVERMVLETAQGGGDALPLLQVTLQTLYQRAGRDAKITTAEYEHIGGVRGALQQRADRVVDELAQRGLGHAVVPLLLRLVTIGERGEPTSRRVRRHGLTDDERAVADAFIDARLLIAAGGDGDPATIAVAHEALVRSWPVAARAIEESRTALRLRSELERYAADWEAGARDDAYLLRGTRLATYEDLIWDQRHDLGRLEREYLTASQTLASAELSTARRSNRRLRALASGLSVAVALMALAGGVAVVRNREAQRQALLAAAALLSARSEAIADSQPDLAIALGLQSMSLGRHSEPTPPAGLVGGLARVAHATRVIAHSNDQIHAVSYSPEGTMLAHAGWDRAVRLVDTAAGAAVGDPMTGHTDSIMTMAFSPDGRRIATAGHDRTVRLWDPRSGWQQRPPLTGHADLVTAVAFAHDGDLLASADRAGTVRLWDPRTGERVGSPVTLGAQTWALAFSPNERTLAVGSDRQVSLWTPGTPADDSAVIAHPGLVYAIAFNRDGSELAVGGTEAEEGAPARVRVYQLPSQTEKEPALEPLPADVRSVAYSPVADLLASTSSDGTVQLAETGSMDAYPQPLRGHTNLVKSVVFSPDGWFLATAGWDRTVRTFAVAPSYSVRSPLSDQSRNVSAIALAADGTVASADDSGFMAFHDVRGSQVGPPLHAHYDSITAIDMTADGTVAATGTSYGAAAIWDVGRRRVIGQEISTGLTKINDVAFDPEGTRLAIAGWEGTKMFDQRRPTTPPVDVGGHVESVEGVSFSPDGQFLVTASADQRVILHRMDRGGRRRVFRDHGGPVYGVAFSPRGDAFASAGDDGTVAIREVPSGRRRRLINAHGERLRTVAFSHDGARIAAAGESGIARVWSATTGEQIGYQLTGHSEPITAVAFATELDGLFTAGDGLWRWDLGFDRWTDVGCAVANRNLTAAEWRDFLPDRPYERTCPHLPAGRGAPSDAPAARYGRSRGPRSVRRRVIPDGMSARVPPRGLGMLRAVR